MRTLLSAGQLLIGPAGERIPGGAVLVDGTTITAVGPLTELEHAADIGEHVHHPGGTLLPGLIDMHVHLCFSPGSSLDAESDTDERDLVLTMAGHARALLDAGVTTARDLGGFGDLAVRVRNAIAAGRLDGPRLRVAGSPLTTPRGHCWFLGGQVAAGDEAALRRAVRTRADAGVDWIKVMASGGASTPGGASMWERQFDAADLRIVVDEAARHGLPVAVHAHGADSIADAVVAGVATVEHATWMTGLDTSDHRTEVAAAMAEHGVVACTADPGRWRLLAEWAGDERAHELMGRMRWMAGQGVGIVLGTDAGLVPFDTLPRSLALWADWGFSMAETIEASTARAADVLGLAAVTGRLAAGLAADVLLVDGDPLAEPGSLAAPVLVMACGRVYRP
ncbi:amidohydrolase family protein [Amycolatopsis sp. NPDC004079]|uniref:amidohydrolase family protein n=1 Tax=Amycolatopsis sp. NPDC004079 TaxID=3154549 RepID=UPI0033BE0EE6